MKKTLVITFLIVSQAMSAQLEYVVYKADFKSFNNSTNKYELVESKKLNNRVFLSTSIFKVEKFNSQFDIFNISSFSNKETDKRSVYKIIANWENRDNEDVIMMYVDETDYRSMVVFGKGYSIIYYLK